MGKPDLEAGPLPDQCRLSALSSAVGEKGGGPIRQMAIMRFKPVCKPRRGSKQWTRSLRGWTRPEPERLTREVLSIRNALVQHHPNANRSGVARSTSPRCGTDQRFRWSVPIWSPLAESNHRHHPYHRCAAGFTTPCSTQRFRTTAQVKSAVESCAVVRGEVACDVVSGKVWHGPVQWRATTAQRHRSDSTSCRSGRNSPTPARADARGGERACLERLSPYLKALFGIRHGLEGDPNGATDRR